MTRVHDGAAAALGGRAELGDDEPAWSVDVLGFVAREADMARAAAFRHWQLVGSEDAHSAYLAADDRADAAHKQKLTWKLTGVAGTDERQLYADSGGDSADDSAPSYWVSDVALSAFAPSSRAAVLSDLR